MLAWLSHLRVPIPKVAILRLVQDIVNKIGPEEVTVTEEK